MRTIDLIYAFVQGERKGKASNMQIDGDCLIHYGTVIAQRIDGKIVVNDTRYSVTTSKQQTRLKAAVSDESTIRVQGVPMGTQDLYKYIS